MISKTTRWLERNPRIAWSLTVGYMALIFLLSSISHIEQPGILKNKNAPLAEHVLEYSFLGFLLSGSLSSTKFGNGKIIILAVSIAILYGALDEIHQFFVPGRDCNIVDLLADSIGSIIGVKTASMGKDASFN